MLYSRYVRAQNTADMMPNRPLTLNYTRHEQKSVSPIKNYLQLLNQFSTMQTKRESYSLKPFRRLKQIRLPHLKQKEQLQVTLEIKNDLSSFDYGSIYNPMEESVINPMDQSSIDRIVVVKQFKITPLIRRFRIVVFYLLAVFKIYNLYTKLVERREEQATIKRNKIQAHFRKIKKQNVQIFKKQIEQWTSKILQKILYLIQSADFIDFANNQTKLSEDRVIDIRRQWISNLTMFLFKNLEFMLRKQYQPTQLKHHLVASLFKKHNQTPSVFVAIRTKYLTNELSEIVVDEQKLIQTEHVIFDHIIPNLFEIANQVKCRSPQHSLELNFQMLSLASALQLHFIRFFESVPTYNKPTVQPIQRQVVYENEKFIFSIDQQLEPEGIIVKGLKEPEMFTNLITLRKKWNQQLGILFQQAVDNLYTCIDI